MAKTDLADVKADIPAIAAMNSQAVPWGWFQEGYDHEPTDPSGKTTHDSYIGHHNGPQYFGYVSENAKETKHLFGLNDFFQIMGHGSLPSEGVMYLRGGYENIDGLKPVDPDAKVQANFAGDDHHPGYSDAGISDALIAREVNAIAKSRYWSQSAIIITYDESEGDYDHVAPQILEHSPAGLPLVSGPRIPLTIISPYANAHKISHESGDHNSIIRFIDELFRLPYLADLPDEANARVKGRAMFGQPNLGPDDDQVSTIHELLRASISGVSPAGSRRFPRPTRCCLINSRRRRGRWAPTRVRRSGSFPKTLRAASITRYRLTSIRVPAPIRQ
ncbi:MAG: hypothetical protein IAI50_07460 [Candidatus Eremiobacteraeota bacterium]|nr:hypothetical protein [Candidatus Eremiobacteraeota bacterium]